MRVVNADPLTYLSITVAFCLVVACASWLPALRAASVDPMRALRSEREAIEWRC